MTMGRCDAGKACWAIVLICSLAAGAAQAQAVKCKDKVGYTTKAGATFKASGDYTGGTFKQAAKAQKACKSKPVCVYNTKGQWSTDPNPTWVTDASVCSYVKGGSVSGPSPSPSGGRPRRNRSPSPSPTPTPSPSPTPTPSPSPSNDPSPSGRPRRNRSPSPSPEPAPSPSPSPSPSVDPSPSPSASPSPSPSGANPSSPGRGRGHFPPLPSSPPPLPPQTIVNIAALVSVDVDPLEVRRLDYSARSELLAIDGNTATVFRASSSADDGDGDFTLDFDFGASTYVVTSIELIGEFPTVDGEVSLPRVTLDLDKSGINYVDYEFTVDPNPRSDGLQRIVADITKTYKGRAVYIWSYEGNSDTAVLNIAEVSILGFKA